MITAQTTPFVDVPGQSATRERARITFYVGMSTALLVTVLIGFAPTLYLRAAFEVSPIRPAVWVHGIVLTAWFIAFFVQTALLAGRRVAVHRRFGWVTAGIGFAVIASATAITLASVAERFAQGLDLDAVIGVASQIIWSNAAGILVFTVLLSTAIVLRRNAETHKRIMLLASISIVQPAFSRIFRWPIFEGFWIDFITLAVAASFLFVVALALYDLRAGRRLHRATLIGGSFFIACKLLGVFVIAATDMGQSVVRALAAATTASAPFPDAVRTGSGLVSGTPGAHADIRIFKGIPFAAPPTGQLRWREPQPPIAWDGVRNADAFGPRCMQFDGAPGARSSAEAAAQPMSEDCLYLNVWTGAVNASERRPVIVWSHGGAFLIGAGSLFDGEPLARKGAVVVTYNYRLGPFGFFAHPELTRESGRNASSNYALMDFAAALEWVHENIAAFGGDPDRVTVVGQSAGGYLEQYAVVSGRIAGRFQRVISQSAPVRILPLATLAEAERAGRDAAAKLGANTLAELRSRSTAEIHQGLEGGRPIIDGWYLSEEPLLTLRAGRQKDVDLLVGANKDEGTFPYLRARVLGLGGTTAHVAARDAPTCITSRTSRPSPKVSRIAVRRIRPRSRMCSTCPGRSGPMSIAGSRTRCRRIG